MPAAMKQGSSEQTMLRKDEDNMSKGIKRLRYSIRTLSAVTPVVRLPIVATIGAVLIVVRSSPKLRGMKDERFPKMVLIPNLGPSVSLLTVPLNILVSVAQPLLEETGDVVGYTLKLLVALGLGSLEPPRYMASDKRHRNCVRARAMPARGAGLGLKRNGRQD